MNPFVNLSVQPSYSKKEVLVSWNLIQGYEQGLLFLYRSFTGTAPWELLNAVEGEEVISLHGSSYLDQSFFVQNRLTETHYRMLLQMPDGTEYESPVVSMFGRLTRRQWSAVAKILSREHLRLRVADGIEMWHYIPLKAGEVSSQYDPDTDQQATIPCKDDEETGYGMKYIGGFAPPVKTFVALAAIAPFTAEDNEAGMGTDDAVVITQARMMAHPKPGPGHMLVHPESDNRYVVRPQIQGYYFKGIVAVAYDASLQLLRRSDPRYAVPLPMTST